MLTTRTSLNYLPTCNWKRLEKNQKERPEEAKNLEKCLLTTILPPIDGILKHSLLIIGIVFP